MATLPPQPSWVAAHAQRRRGSSPPAMVRKEPCPGSDQNVMPLLRTTRYSELHSWFIFAPFYPSGRSRIPPRKIRQYYCIDVKTRIFCHHHFLGSRHPGHPLHQYSWAQLLGKSDGPTRGLGTEAQATGRASGGSALAGFGRPPARTHPLGPGTEEERWPTRRLGTEAQA